MPQVTHAGEFQLSPSAEGDVRHFAALLAIAWALPAWLRWDFVLPYLIIVTLLFLGISVVLRNVPSSANLSEKFVLYGPVFFAMPLAFFGTEHFLDPASIENLIPKWVPAHTFLTYFVGSCLIAGGLGILFRKRAGLAAGLIGIMFLFFEALMHIPLAISLPHNRILWMVAVRDFCFSSGALSLAATYTTQWRVQRTHWLISGARVVIGGGIIFYGVQHFLHPELLPGVPLRQLTPAFIPGHLFWGYLTGLVYMVGGVFLVIKKKDRLAAMWLGFFVVCIVLIFCVPFAITRGGTIGALNVPVDTLMFGGAILCLSRSLPGSSIRPLKEADGLEPVGVSSVPVQSVVDA